jgi:hypothetical protein
MKIMHIIATLLLISSLATPTMAQQRTNTNGARAEAPELQGRQVAAPPWSAACMTDHGPSGCGEPMWIYGSSDTRVPYRNAF